MTLAVKSSDPEERRRHQRVRVGCQLAMLEAAHTAFRLAMRSPNRRRSVSSAEVSRLEREWGFEPGTYDTTLEEPQGQTAVVLWGNLEMAIEVTKAEQQAAESPGVDPEFLAAVFRICCATVIGAVIGAPLGALAAQEDILKKVAEAAVVTGVGATAAEVIQRYSVKVTRGPEEPVKLDQVWSQRFSIDVVNEMTSEIERGGLSIPTAFDQDADESGPRQPRGPSGPGSGL